MPLTKRLRCGAATTPKMIADLPLAVASTPWRLSPDSPSHLAFVHIPRVLQSSHRLTCRCAVLLGQGPFAKDRRATPASQPKNCRQCITVQIVRKTRPCTTEYQESSTRPACYSRVAVGCGFQSAGHGRVSNISLLVCSHAMPATSSQSAEAREADHR